jgi:hypothetical protein
MARGLLPLSGLRPIPQLGPPTVGFPLTVDSVVKVD